MCAEVRTVTNPDGGEGRKMATVTDAPPKDVACREQALIARHFGTLDWDPRYDHKADRRSRDEKLQARR